MDYVSSNLSKGEVLTYLDELPLILASLGFSECKVMYGWDCDLPIDDLWQYQHLKVVDLPAFVASSIEGGIFKPGASDLIIESPDGSLSVRACHESDIHLVSSSESALAALAAPIAAQHPDFTFKSDNSWQVRRFSGRA